jgi:pyruvate kinase
VYPILFEPVVGTEALIKRATEILVERKAVQRGDVVVIVSGTQPVRGATNMMKIERIP